MRGTGLWTAIDLTTDKATRASFPMERMDSLVAKGRKRGVIFKYMGPALEFAPPLTITEDEIDEGIRAIDESLAEEETEMGLA